MNAKCPKCMAQTRVVYEGSHDWTLECETCRIRVTIYVPHVRGESENARLAFERLKIRELESE